MSTATALRWLWPATGVAMLFAVLLVPLPVWSTRLGSELENAAHAPLFAAVAICAWYFCRRRRIVGRDPWVAYLQALVIALLLAAATELAQPLTGRDNSLDDVYTDALGAAAALSGWAAVHTARRGGVRLLWLAVGLMAAAVALWPVAYAGLAYQHRNTIAPHLLQPESAMGRYFLQRRAIRFAPDIVGGWRVTPARSQWPGLTVDEVLPDWRPYRTLTIDLRNPGDQPLTVLLRIDDAIASRRYSDRYNSSITLAPRARINWRIGLENLRHRNAGRGLDLEHMRRLILFQDSDGLAAPYVLHDIRLEP